MSGSKIFLVFLFTNCLTSSFGSMVKFLWTFIIINEDNQLVDIVELKWFCTIVSLLILLSHSHDVTGNVAHIFKIMCTFANIRELQLCRVVCLSEGGSDSPVQLILQICSCCSHSHSSPGLLGLMTISYNICISDGQECQNHSNWIKIYTKSVLFICRCTLL